VASRFALRIDALHREAGQKLHIVSPQRPARFAAPLKWRGPDFPDDGQLLAQILAQPASAVKDKYHNILYARCQQLAHSMPGNLKDGGAAARSR
jgi:hypothetical protein